MNKTWVRTWVHTSVDGGIPGVPDYSSPLTADFRQIQWPAWPRLRTDITVAPAERVLLGGESGSGKSTLIRAIAGLWPWGEGRIIPPAGAKLAFVPQRPYIPLGTLRDALAYPVEANLLTEERASSVLKECRSRLSCKEAR
jgi:ABC-type multidrug transport system fused ATPase/permease subunit